MADETRKFEVGIQVYLEKTIESKGIKYTAKMLGWDHSNFIMISNPTANGQPLLWEPGIPFVVKYIIGGKIIIFRTILLEKITKPVTLCLIKFPEKIEEVNIRKHERIQTFIICSISAQSDIKENSSAPLPFEEGSILDLSKSGGLIQVDKKLRYSVGEIILLGFTLPSGNSIQKLYGEIRNVTEDGEKTNLGVFFNDTNREAHLKLELFFKRLELGNLKKNIE